MSMFAHFKSKIGFIHVFYLFIGGAAITEEIVPGFKFSRASYVLGLLRKKIYDELELKVFLKNKNFFFYKIPSIDNNF